MNLAISEISLKNFRNHENLEISFSNPIVLLEGRNGIGKTSVLESIYFLATTKSHRTANDIELVMDNKLFAKASVKTSFGEYEIIISKQGKRVFVDKTEKSKISEYIGGFNAVFFGPDDLELVKSGPVARRYFMDLEFMQLDSEYLQILSTYRKLLKQRNLALKNRDVLKNRTMIDIISEGLYKAGCTLMNKRSKYLELLNIHLQNVYKIFSSDSIAISYKPSVSVNEFRRHLFEKVDVDVNYQQTLVGIHRDDFVFNFNGKDLKSHASQGQQRLVVICLKMALLKEIRQVLKREAILLLDDVLSELDEKVQKTFISSLPRSNMIIMTSAVSSLVIDSLQVINLDNL